jgi:hypothetical protein
MKRILYTSALLLAALCTASAKDYTVTFARPVQVGSVKLAAGEYKVKVNGGTAVFTNSSRKSVDAPVTVQKVEKKSAYTAAETKTVDGEESLSAIDLDGADFKLVF